MDFHVSASVLFVIGLAYLFDFLNGMHDAANSIATVVSTRVLAPRHAVIWAAFFNFAAFAVFGVHVANTIGKGLVDPSVVDTAVVAGALIGASLWSWITIVFGIPVSSSHALIGGMVGAGISKAGTGVLQYDKLEMTVAFIFLSPLIGLFFGFIALVAGIVVGLALLTLSLVAPGRYEAVRGAALDVTAPVTVAFQ